MSFNSRVGRCFVEYFGRASLPGSVVVGGERISDLKPLGGHNAGGITKAGRLSLKGIWKGKPVKVYSVFSPEQAVLRREIDECASEGLRFPTLVAEGDGLVAEAWIDGRAVRYSEKQLLVSKTERFLLSLENDENMLNLARRYKGAFCYLDDQLLPRIGSWKYWEPVAKFLRDWHQMRADIEDALEYRVSHSDLSLRNVMIERRSGIPYVIDNELLGVGRGWILDRDNAALGGLLVKSQELPPSIEQFRRHCWRLRLLGSALTAGKTGRAYHIATNGWYRT